MSLHTVTLADTNYWDAIKTHVQGGKGYIVSDNPPDAYGITRNQWIHRFGIFQIVGGVRVLIDRYDPDKEQAAGRPRYQAGLNLANDIVARILAYGSAVIIDELSIKSVETIHYASLYFTSSWAHLWGVYLVNGPGVSFETLDGGPDANRAFRPITQLLSWGGRIAVEFYPWYHPVTGSQTSVDYNYCTKGKDPWLQTFFVGGTNGYGIAQQRFGWLVNKAQGSASIITPVFGVTDVGDPVAFVRGPASGANPAVFIDRMFYVFKHTAYAAYMAPANNGGPGSWNWSNGNVLGPDGKPLGNVTNTSRDTAYVDSYTHYCTNNQSSWRFAPQGIVVNC